MTDEDAYAVHCALHRLWTRDTSRDGYVKAEWKLLESVLDEGIKAKGVRPGYIDRVLAHWEGLTAEMRGCREFVQTYLDSIGGLCAFCRLPRRNHSSE